MKKRLYARVLVWMAGLILFLFSGVLSSEKASARESAETYEKAISSLTGHMLDQADLRLKKFNKRAILACHQNPAWNRDDLVGDETIGAFNKRVYCMFPIQFRLCATIKVLNLSSLDEIREAGRNCAKDTAEFSKDIYDMPGNLGVFSWENSIENVFVDLFVNRSQKLDQGHMELSSQLQKMLEDAEIDETDLDLSIEAIFNVIVVIVKGIKTYGIREEDLKIVIQALLSSFN